MWFTFVESSYFTNRAKRLLTDDDLSRLQIELIERPDAGKLIERTGGLRKLRFARPGRGKRGDLRVVYHWERAKGRVRLLAVYAKNEYDDLPAAWLQAALREETDNG